MYLLSFHGLETVWESYLPGFQTVYESIEMRTGYVSDDLLYVFMKSYIDPGNVFNVSISLGWRVSDVEDFKDTVRVEPVRSLDQQAEMQIAIYAAEEVLTPQNIGQTAIGLLKDLIANDLRINANEVLRNWRIRLDWTSNSTGQTGFPFFWLNGTDLYLLTFMQDNQHPEVYQRMLYEIGDSFQLVGEEVQGST